MSAPTSLSHQQQHYESNLDKRSSSNNKDNKMSSSNYMTTTINNNNDNSAYPIDLIESKFNELAKKILDELKQSKYSREFFQAIDVILNEPPVLQHDIRAKKLANHTRQLQQQRTKRLKEGQSSGPDTHHDDKLVVDNLEIKKQCELIMEKQRQQQEQLDNHQQILFDSQYRSLPAEITEAVAGHEQRRANAKASPQKTAGSTLATSKVPIQPSSSLKETSDIVEKATGKQQTIVANKLQQPVAKSNGVKTAPLTRSKENLAPTKRGSGSKEQRQRSAIPHSMIPSSTSQKTDNFAYPITKSATVGSSTVSAAAAASGLSPSGLLGSGLVRQASLRLNKQTQETQQEFIKQQTRPLAASEKLKQRRPTKANLLDQRQLLTHESDNDLDDDDDDDDDEFEYQNLVSRRAYLNQRFINQQQQEPSTKVSEKSSEPAVGQQQTGRHRQQVTSTIQSGVKQASLNTANMTVAKQKQRFSNEAQVVRSNTIGGGQMVRPGVVRQSSGKPVDDEPSDRQHEPRSLGGLLTSHDISQLYKPHMNYSTSLLGNHRLSDDDEIIIIPTAQSPSLMSASVSPVGPHQQQQYPDDQHADRTTNNIDEFSERFSISRTKSFWEKLANSKSGGGGGGEDVKCNPSPQQDKQYINSSQRSLSSGPNLVADSKSSQCSLLNQSGNNTGQTTTGHHYPAAMKNAFDRMDSTGGSGNSHYSGCSSSSSTSGDEQTLTGHMNLAERRSMLASAATGTADRPGHHHQKQRGQPANASMNPTINQLVQQDQINRSDRFRQTR